ncbi:MAG: hypothetical protein ABI905_06885 [Betaproteobacteria bacterium]
MKKVWVFAVTASLVGLAGCATKAETDAYVKYKASQTTDGETLTGSRLVKPTTERMVGAIGNKEYNELNLHKGIANSVGDKSN